MHERVMEAAQEGEIFQAGFASVGPVLLVVDITPPGFAITTLPGAMSIAHDHRSSHPSRDGSGPTPHIYDF